MNPFRRPSVHYGRTPEPETPYQTRRAGLGRAHRLGPRAGEELAADGVRLAVPDRPGLAAGLVWQSARGTVVPWVVQVDKLGQAQAVGPAVADYRPTDPQIAWHLARFIEQVRRSLPMPSSCARTGCEPTSSRPTAARSALNDYARANDPFAQGRQAPDRGRGLERHPRLRRTASASPGSSAATRTASSPPPNAGPPSSPSSCSRRATPSGCARTRSASTSTPSTGRRSSDNEAVIRKAGRRLWASPQFRPPDRRCRARRLRTELMPPEITYDDAPCQRCCGRSADARARSSNCPSRCRCRVS